MNYLIRYDLGFNLGPRTTHQFNIPDLSPDLGLSQGFPGSPCYCLFITTTPLIVDANVKKLITGQAKYYENKTWKQYEMLFYKINYIHNYKIAIHKNNTVTGQKQKQLTFLNSTQG